MDKFILSWLFVEGIPVLSEGRRLLIGDANELE